MFASVEHQLLHAALLCGMRPDSHAVYRLQLFLIANRDLGSKNHQNDFQRTLETAVDKKGLFENHEYRGSGEYVITSRGYEEALSQIGSAEQKYEPTQRSKFRATMRGVIGEIAVDILTRERKSTVYFGGKLVRSAKEACNRLEIAAGLHLPTQSDSAVRILQDLAIDHRFQIEFR